MSAVLASNTTIIDGWIVDVETGEQLGVAVQQGFTIGTNDEADWVLSKMLAEQSAIDSVLANAKAIADRHQKRLDLLNKRFGAELEHFAKSQLEGKRERTLSLLYGSLSFRAVKGTNKIVDMAQAVAFCKERAPDLIHTEEKVMVSEVLGKFPDIVKADVTEDGETIECDVLWIEATGPHDKFTVKLGASK